LLLDPRNADFVKHLAVNYCALRKSREYGFVKRAGLVDASLGRAQEAIEEAKRAEGMLPIFADF
jgi:hypothetical protein